MCWLQSIPGFGASSARKMLENGLCAEDLYHADQHLLMRMTFLKEGMAERILSYRQHLSPNQCMEQLQKKNIHFTCLELSDYPKKLKDLPDAPYGLYYIGSLPVDSRFTVSIVGARSCSTYGYFATKSIARELSESGVQIISGMARGVDCAAQVSAADAGFPSWAVLGCGPDICYPQENYALYEKLCHCGGIISEYPPGTRAKRYFFPMRNRIISGFSDCTIVVEARHKSGSLITAACAREQGRDVYAVPGQIDSTLSRGCHELIHDGAGIYFSTAEFLKDQSVFYEEHSAAGVCANLEKREKLVYSRVNLLPENVQQIVEDTGLSMTDVTDILISLQTKGLVLEISKNHFVRTLPDSKP